MEPLEAPCVTFCHPTSVSQGRYQARGVFRLGLLWWWHQLGSVTVTPGCPGVGRDTEQPWLIHDPCPIHGHAPGVPTASQES